MFVEGAHYLSSRGRDLLIELWCELVAWNGIERERVDVYGFSKSQIVAMSNNPRLRLPATEPLDIQIARAHASKPFDVLIVAFDATPPNQDLLPHRGCLEEIRYLILRFVARERLPAQFVSDGKQLLAHYARIPRRPRKRQYAPRVDAIFMEPEFESLIVCDERAVLRGLGHKQRPRGWPPFRMVRNPKVLLTEAIGHAADEVRAQIRGDVKSNRHGWALRIVRSAEHDSPMRSHPIIRHLRALVA